MTVKKLKIKLKAFSAKPLPPISPILSSHGINTMLFCKQYNDLTKNFVGLEIPVMIIIVGINKFKLNLISPSFTFLVNLLSVNNMLNINSFKFICNIKKKDLYPLSNIKYLKLFGGILKSMNVILFN